MEVVANNLASFHNNIQTLLQEDVLISPTSRDAVMNESVSDVLSDINNVMY
ncbi:MAG TPA: hypothetical protein VFZ46_06895 [Nitrososphaeraceae archaeon]